MNREFHITALVTAATGTFICRDGFSALHELLDYMTGDELLTHQLVLAAGAIKPDLYEQHPWLSDVTGVETVKDEATLETWTAAAAARWGEWHRLVPNPAAWGSHDPIEDFVALGGRRDRVIPVALPEQTEEP